MKRTLPAIVLLVLTTSALAAETQRYLVATRRPAITANIRQIVGEAPETLAIAPFDTFNGFAATLTEAEVEALRESSEVRWIEPVVERVAFAQPRNPMRQTVPFGINTIVARPAQAGFVKGIVNVAVIDSGVDYRHPELQTAYAGGFDVMSNTPDPLDQAAHGTHVAGTIAAADNDIGVIGIAPKARIWSVKVLDSIGRGTSETVLKGVDWVVAKKEELGGNWIINLSLGSTEESAGEREAFQRLADKGILVIAATGNASTATIPAPVAYPAAYPSVVAVGAVTFDQKLASFSNRGPEVDLTAPGVDVLSTVPMGTRRISYFADGDEATVTEIVNGSKRGVVSAEFVYCGFGRPEDFPSVSRMRGRIALIKRGEAVSFADKTRRAKEMGAVAVAIFDNEPVPSGTTWTLYHDESDREYEWPVTVRLTLQQGETLVAQGSHPITIAYTEDDYGELSGTSMACPHVVGAAALLWGLAPNATAQQVRNALVTTAVDLGDAGIDPKFGAGLINTNAAARLLAPEAFSGITTGRPIGLRGRK